MIAIQDILTTRKPKVGHTKFIAVDGRGGSGKSTLAQFLAKEFKAQLILTDDFASPDNPLNWWPLLIERIFKPIADGATTLSYPRSEWWPTHHPEPAVNQPVTPIMVLEGVSALRKEFRPYISLGIFVDTPAEICLQRGIERDLNSQTGKSKEEVIKLWQQWQANENDYMQRDKPKEYADVLIDGTRPVGQQLKQLI